MFTYLGRRGKVWRMDNSFIKTFRVEESVWLELRALAEMKDVSTSQAIRLAIVEYIEREKKNG